MAVLHTLSAIGRLIRRAPPPPAEILEAYAHEVIPVLDRAEWLYDYWLEQSTLFTDGEKLGNVAAIHRWETATMGRSLERVIPPAVLAGAHEQVIDALELASRAAQLLSNGSRFHNANAVCEGQSMLAVSRERRLAALKSMRRYLLRNRLDARAEADAAAAAALAEVARATANADTSAGDSSAGRPAEVVTTATDAPELTATDGDPSVAPQGAAPPPEWPEHDHLDIIVADASEPEPSWLSAAQLAASAPPDASSEGTATRPEPTPAPPGASPASPPSGTARPGDLPADLADRDGWGGLFGRKPDQPGS
jgi:hypothetical protein